MKQKFSMIFALVVGWSVLISLNQVNGQNQFIQCATMVEGGVVIVDLTCPNHTQTIKVLLDFGYIINIETASEMNLQPTTDTVEKLKEMGIDLNYTLALK